MPTDIIKKNSKCRINSIIFEYFLWFVFMSLGLLTKECKKSKKKPKYF